MGKSLTRSAGRPKAIPEEEFAREYRRFRSGEYGKIPKNEFIKKLEMSRSTFGGIPWASVSRKRRS